MYFKLPKPYSKGVEKRDMKILIDYVKHIVETKKTQIILVDDEEIKINPNTFTEEEYDPNQAREQLEKKKKDEEEMDIVEEDEDKEKEDENLF